MHAASSERSASNGHPGASAGRAAGLDQGRKGLAGLMMPADPWMRAAQLALIGLFVIAILWSAQVSQPVLVPVLLAWVIATIFLPVVRFLQDRGVPRTLTAVLLTVALVVGIVGFLLIIAAPLSTWVGRATELRLLLQQKFQMLGQPLALLEEAKRNLSSITSEPGAVKVQQPADVVTATFGVLMPAASQFALFVGALLFYLIYQERIRTAAVLLFSGRDARLEALHTLQSIDENMATYFSTYTVVNLCLGVVTFGLACAADLPNPLLWGVLACVLNFIPYLGPAIVAATLALVGLLTFPSLGAAAVAPLAYVAIVAVEGQIITPCLMGRRLDLNPFAVFLAIAFCMWLWGPVGAFLAVPLLMAATVAGEHAFAEAKPALPD